MASEGNSKTDRPIHADEERLRRELALMAEPIDFEELCKTGLLAKAGAWYRVKDIQKLPEHVRVKISDIHSDEKGMKVKFSNHKESERLQKKYR